MEIARDGDFQFESRPDFNSIKKKVSNVQDRVRRLEGAPTGGGKAEERKHGKMSFSACLEVKGKTEYFQNRNSELAREQELLKLELSRLSERSKQVEEVRASYAVLEGELRVCQSDLLSLRNKLDSSRKRNDHLSDELTSLRGDLRWMRSKVTDNDLLLEALTAQQSNFHDLIERQRTLRDADHRLFREDLREVQTKHTTHLQLLEQVHELSEQSDAALNQLQHRTPLVIYVNGKSTQVDALTDSTTGVPPSAEEAPLPEEVKEGDEEEKELATLKQVFESSQDELEHLIDTALSNNDKLNEWRGQLLHSRALYIQRKAEVQELQTKRVEYQSCSSSKKALDDELLLKQSVAEEEHRFLADFWHAVVDHSIGFFGIYTTHVQRTKMHFVDALSRLLEDNVAPSSVGEVLSL